MSEVKEIKEEGKIDKDVLDVMHEEDILKALSDDKQIKRVILNCFCEFLSEVKEMRKSVEDLVNQITICSADKLKSFFKELESNVSEEEKKMEVYDKAHRGHKKSKKTAKSEKFSKKSVK